MEILVTGANGQLGIDLVKELYKRGYNVICPSRYDMNLEDKDKIKEYIMNSNYDAIIHCGAYTSVDKAEQEKDLCLRINKDATEVIAICSKKLDIPMIYVSTDYIFDGSKDEEYTEKDIPNPINMYGISKYLGEKSVISNLDKYYVVRTSWVFGTNGNNFIETMLNISKIRNKINVVDDQIGSPTYTVDLSRLLVDILESNKYGIYNATNEGYCTWYEFAKEIFKISNINIKINPISSNEYKCMAKRPLNSRLSKNKLVESGFQLLPTWKEALTNYIQQRENNI